MNSIELKPICSLADSNFIIGSYQRGYKWGKKEVLELLNDIHNFDSTQGLYCLQPVILKPFNGANYYEVIDGQQRTTTIYLLLKYLEHTGRIDKRLLYTIDFQTRKRSGDFLDNDLEALYDMDFSTIEAREIVSKEYDNLEAIHKLWNAFVSKNIKYNNVDVYHFFTVTCYVIRWLEEYLKEDELKDKFVKKLLNHVHIIWYSLDSAQRNAEIIKIFLNNNKGRIRLTSSELVKALCILEIKNSELEAIAGIQINQFATEWDMIEKQLQDDRFWYFLQPDDTKYLQGTRIDFLFDLHFKEGKANDDYFAYRQIEKILNDTNQTIAEEWENIIQLYYKLLNWYQDQALYHYIGYITNAEIRSLFELLSTSQNKNKVEFEQALKEIIVTEFKRKKKDKDSEKEIHIYALENLHYKKYYKETLNILLLYNVLYYIDNMAKYKFPFELFVKQKWSIEHITPQNPKDLPDGASYLQWAKDLIAYVGENIDQVLVDKINAIIKAEDISKDKALLQEMSNLASVNEDLTHSIQNLLLVDKNTNSSLSNHLFGTKRKKILEFDRLGVNEKDKEIFIPIETLNAFNKTFSSKINIENWTKEDSDNYVDSINARLSNYLPKSS